MLYGYLNLHEMTYTSTEMTTIKDVIGKLEITIKDLNNLSERIWKLENPPKYKYGDTGYIPLLGVKHPVKILEAKFVKTEFALINTSTFHWEYLVDITGVGLATYPENQIQL